MGLFKKKMPPPEACPACGDQLSAAHCEVHTHEVAGGFIFECACGVSTMKWPSPDTAAMCMAVHLDHDHNTHVSQFGNDRTTLGMLYRESFPRGAVQHRQAPTPFNLPRKGEAFTLTTGQQLVAIIGKDQIPDTWEDLAQRIVAASGDHGDDAAYIALVGLFRVMPVAWSDVLSEPVRVQASSETPPELNWFRGRSVEEGVRDESDYEIIKVATMLAQPGTLDDIRGSL